MDVIIGPAAGGYVADRDDMRLRAAEKRTKEALKEGRTAGRKAAAAQQALFEEEESELYEPGIAD